MAEQLIDPINIINGTFMCGGEDENGEYVLKGPMTRNVWAIMIFTEDPETRKFTWLPYKIYNSNKSKVYKRARKKLLSLRIHYNQRFRIEEIWENVPLEEMDKIYVKENQIEEAQTG